MCPYKFLSWQIEGSPQPVPSGPTPVITLSGGNILIVSADDPELGKLSMRSDKCVPTFILESLALWNLSLSN